MSGIFSSVDALNPQKSGFNLSHTVDGDCKLGECIPTLCEEMVPGDYWKIGNINKIRFQPLIAPISDDIDVKFDYFFVPYRLVFNEDIDGAGNSWEKFITQVPTEYNGSVPTFAVSMPKWNPSEGKYGTYSLWDYLGMQTGVKPKGKALPCALHKRSYNLIIDEYYRDENLQDEIDIDGNEDICWSNVSKDYYTSAFLERQRGPATGLPVSTMITGDSLNGIPFTTYINQSGTSSVMKEPVILRMQGDTGTFGINGSSVRGHYINAVKDGDGNIRSVSSGHTYSDGSNTYSDELSQGVLNATGTTEAVTRTSTILFGSDVASKLSATSVSVDISDLRLAYQVQKWQERSLRGGVRYTEFLHSFFGVNPRDDRLQRPEYLGGIRCPVITQDIVQHSESTDSSAMATDAGHMISADAQSIRPYKAQEFGLVMCIMRILPKIKYTQGINRQWLRNTPFDFYFPTFAHLSEQGIFNEEVFVTDDDEETNLSVWGYQGIYNEMRYKPNRVVGGLRDSSKFLFWSMARKFSSLPNLNGNFISTANMQTDFMRVFNIKDENVTRPVIFHVYNMIEAYRPMPYLATPL